jgi:transcriptional regulator with XRE-family HTH domain
VVEWNKGDDSVYLPGTINQRIGDLRSSKGIAQKEFCKLIGIAPSQLSRIENGKTKTISSDILIKISKALGVSSDYILGLTKISTPKSYDISELELSEGAVKTMILDSMDMETLNRIVEHKRFPYLMQMVKRYFNDETAPGIMGRNEMIDFATSTLGDFAKENPEHKAEVREDIRDLKSTKLGEYEADLEKIKSTFMSILKDIKKEIGDKKEPAPIATADFMQGVWAQLQDKPRSEITEEDVSEAVTNMLGKTTTLDGRSADMFRKLMTWMLKKSNK